MQTIVLLEMVPFNFHNSSGVNIYKNSTKTFYIKVKNITVHYVIGFYGFLSHLLILVVTVTSYENIVSVQGMQ